MNGSGPFTLSGQGTENDTVHLLLDLDDVSASLDGSTKRFARAGTFVVDVTARYQNQPTVSHTQRLTFTIGQVDSVDVVPSGTVGVSAQPVKALVFPLVCETPETRQHNTQCPVPLNHNGKLCSGIPILHRLNLNH